MVNYLTEKPDGQLKDVNDKCIYFEFVHNGMPYAYFAFQLFSESSVIHSDVTKWNHNIAKQAQIDFKYVLDFLKTRGIKKVIALYPGIDKKWIKFIKMFGFPEPEYLLSSTKEL